MHTPALRMFFAQDDVTFLARARGLTPTPWSLARPLSEGWMWRGLHAAFGLEPLPYHIFGLALHLASTAMVYAIGSRILGGRAAAFAAALLFGASSIVFTPLHWTSGIVELLVTAFSLAAFLLWLVARQRRATGLLWLAALAGLAAVLSKESAILLPLVLLVAHFGLGHPRPGGARDLIPQAAVTAAYAIALLATLRLVHYVGSETYSMSGSPAFVGLNLATYLRWLVALHVPVRDAVAAMDPNAWRIGLPVAIAMAIVLWTQRREPRHPEEVGAAWFFAFLAPVVALKHHTYLYYLYLPWPGLCWLVAGAGARLVRLGSGAARADAREGRPRSERPAAPLSPAIRTVALGAAVAALAVFAGVEYSNVRARERAMVGPFALDKTVREAGLLRNAVRDLTAAKLERGDHILFINPAPRRHVTVGDTTRADAVPIHSYIPLEGALRGGEAIRVFFPGIEYLGFDSELRPDREDANVFVYWDEGNLRPIGRGGHALAELGYYTLRFRDFPKAEAMFLRSRALGDTLPDATFGLIITSDFLGRPADVDRYCKEFLRRWPDDWRAPTVAAGTSSEGVLKAPAQ